MANTRKNTTEVVTKRAYTKRGSSGAAKKSASKASSKGISKASSKSTSKATKSASKKAPGKARTVILGDTSSSSRVPTGTRRAIEAQKESKITVQLANGSVVSIDTEKIKYFQCDGLTLGSLGGFEEMVDKLSSMLSSGGE